MEKLTDNVKKLISIICGLLQFKRVDIEDILEEIESLLDVIKMMLKEKENEKLFYKDLERILE